MMTENPKCPPGTQPQLPNMDGAERFQLILVRQDPVIWGVLDECAAILGLYEKVVEGMPPEVRRSIYDKFEPLTKALHGSEHAPTYEPTPHHTIRDYAFIGSTIVSRKVMTIAVSMFAAAAGMTTEQVAKEGTWRSSDAYSPGWLVLDGEVVAIVQPIIRHMGHA